MGVNQDLVTLDMRNALNLLVYATNQSRGEATTPQVVRGFAEKFFSGEKTLRYDGAYIVIEDVKDPLHHEHPTETHDDCHENHNRIHHTTEHDPCPSHPTGQCDPDTCDADCSRKS